MGTSLSLYSGDLPKVFALLHMQQDIHTNVPETLVDIAVAVAEYEEAQAIQRGVPLLIADLSFLFVVLGTIDFDDDSGGWDVEVNDEGADDLLAFCLDTLWLEELIPEVFFLARHFTAELLSVGLEGFVVAFGCHRHLV